MIRRARLAYRQSGAKIHLPTRDRTAPNTLVRASSLGLCPLQAAYQKLEIKPDLADVADNPDKAWLMDHGNYVAPMVQEALMWYAMSEIGYAFEAEKPFTNTVLGVSGRLDGLLTYSAGLEPQKCVIEIKDTEGKANRSIGEPQLRYALQLLVYMLSTGCDQGAIVCVSKWTWTTWTMRPINRGYMIFDDHDRPYTPAYGTNWNVAYDLTEARLLEELDLQKKYMDTVAEHGKADPPYDPFNDPMSWLCTWQEKPTARKKEGWAKPNCGYAKRCHGLDDKTYTTEKVDGRIQIKQEA